MRLRSFWHFHPDDAGYEKQADDCDEGDRIDVLPMAPLVLLQPVIMVPGLRGGRPRVFPIVIPPLTDEQQRTNAHYGQENRT